MSKKSRKKHKRIKLLNRASKSNNIEKDIIHTIIKNK